MGDGMGWTVDDDGGDGVGNWLGSWALVPPPPPPTTTTTQRETGLAGKPMGWGRMSRCKLQAGDFHSQGDLAGGWPDDARDGTTMFFLAVADLRRHSIVWRSRMDKTKRPGIWCCASRTDRQTRRQAGRPGIALPPSNLSASLRE